MDPEKIFVVLNQSDYLLGVFSTEGDAKFQAEVFTKANKDAGYRLFSHRVIEYTKPRELTK